MVSTLPKLALLVGAVALLYQAVLKNLLFTVLGVGRIVHPLESFGVRCEKIKEPGLEACEDMWLHEPSGLLYIACSDSLSKIQWNPSVEKLNASGRGLNDRIAILDTRAPGSVSQRLKWMDLLDFPGINGDGTINLQGFDVHVGSDDPPTLRMLLVNNRPFLDPVTGALLDATKLGANATIELFQTTLGSTKLRYLKTYHDPAIQTPNNVAFMGPDAFVITNDRSVIHGFRRKLDAIIGGGSIAYCNTTNCHIALSSGFNYPNGLIRGADGLIYVPTVITGEIHVLALTNPLPSSSPSSPSPSPGLPTLQRLKVLRTGYPIDNLSLDKLTGDIYAAVFPSVRELVKSFEDPLGRNPPSAVLRIRRRGRHSPGPGQGEGEEALEYEIEKVLEDDGGVLPGSTVAVHDAGVPERYFMGGVYSPFITICEKI